MKNLKLIYSLVITLTLLLNSSILWSQTTEVVTRGNAVDAKGKIAYKEVHTMTKLPNGELKKINTKYFSVSDVLIAEITSTFDLDPFLPETYFIDYRFKQEQRLSYDPTKNIIKMSVTDLNKNKTETKELKRTDNMVAGQGFHNYILRNFDAKETDIKFIVLPRLDFFTFKLQSLAQNDPNKKTFVLKISNWILRAIVEKIVVTYRVSDKVLLDYDGLTNIEDDKKNSQILKIKFDL